MNEIRDLFPGRMRERTFQLKARRDAGAVWHEPQFVECKQCGRRATRTIWTRSLYVCPNCGYHMPIGGYYRLSLVLDHGSFRELDADLPPQDVLRFPGYPEKLTAAQNKTGLREAAVTATGRIGGVACVAEKRKLHIAYVMPQNANIKANIILWSVTAKKKYGNHVQLFCHVQSIKRR